MNREVAVSKALSKLLRHAAEDAGLTLDDEGYARVDQVVSQQYSSLQIMLKLFLEEGASPNSFTSRVNVHMKYFLILISNPICR